MKKNNNHNNLQNQQKKRNELQNLLNINKFNNSISIPYSMFNHGVYNFIITKCNYFKRCSTIHHQLYVLGDASMGVPIIKIFGNSHHRTILRNESLILVADAYVAICTTDGTQTTSTSTSISDIVLTWSIKKNNGLIIDSFASISRIYIK